MPSLSMVSNSFLAASSLEPKSFLALAVTGRAPGLIWMSWVIECFGGWSSLAAMGVQTAEVDQMWLRRELSWLGGAV